MKMDALFVVLTAVLSLGSALHLWLRARGSAFRKVRWSAVLLLPFFGPIFYAAFYRVPQVQPGDLQARQSDDLWAAPHHRHDADGHGHG
jgi:hypothetical protein